jgi:signal transduction histidine kinase
VKLGRSLAVRIVFVAFISGLAGILLARSVTNVAATEAVADGLRAHLAGGEQARCEADPAAFSVHFGAGFRAFAYDETSRRSAFPAAPPLRTDLAERASRVGTFAAERANPWRAERTMVVRVADAGPCALVLATWPTRLFTVRLARGLGASVFASALLSALLGLWFVARPLGRRVARLEARADALGRSPAQGATIEAASGGVAARVSGGGDELDVVEVALDRASTRIHDDARELAIRAETLERHLEEVAHDLRTPLASLQLAVEQARAASTFDPDSAEARHLEDALRGCVFLDALIGDLRDAARLEGGWQPGETAELHDLTQSVEHVVRRAAVLARARGVLLDYAVPEEPVLVACDPLGCERVLENLLVNAIEHGKRGGHVALTLRLDPGEPGGRFVLDLLDEGPGLAAFPPARAPEAAPEPGVRGRGLHVVAALLEKLAWTLTLEPNDEGTHVRVEGRALASGA